ncbi:MAG TPA: ATP-dependent DNA helicase [Frankiaceae bacterium]|nr:ATP-dependent DNA helicase [Frankiaceae bacterium]
MPTPPLKEAETPSRPAPRLVRPPDRSARVVRLDGSQRRVVDHRAGPLVVLAGPGTGKTATLVEVVADRVERDGLAPEQVLVLTFSRRAADELRTRLAGRLRRTVRGRLAWTFHSWCFALVRAMEPEFASAAPRLLSGPEQDVVVRDLLGAQISTRWPEELRPLLGSRGFAAELRNLIARCQERGLDPEDLDRLGEMSGRPGWRAVAGFFQEYLDVMQLQGQLDYAGLVRRAAGLLTDPEVLDEVLREVRLVVVDEYQDTDPSQEQVLRALASGGAEIVVVGDPDQSIYAFRGADVSNILEFATRFRRPDGRAARRVALDTCRRSGPELVRASRAVAARIPLPGLPVSVAEAHRRLRSAPAGDQAGSVRVRLFGSPAHEAAAVADLLRRAHLIDGLSWGSMAVLVRSTRSAGPLLRALSDAGVPVETPSDEVPLARESTLAPLLTLLRLVIEPSRWDEESATALLTSPLGGADALQLRRLRHHLLTNERAAGGTRRSGDLLGALLQDPAAVVQVPERLRVAPGRISRLHERARVAADAGLPAEDVLWAVWSDSAWRRELEAASALGAGSDWMGGGVVTGATGSGARAAARHADRQLDAMVALFEAAARFSDRLPGARISVFLDELTEQEIPADPLSQAGAPAAAVQVLTAHRSKGLEWDLVVVAGVQEGGWPDLRRRQSLLETGALPAVLAAARSAGGWAASATGEVPLPLPPPMPPEAELAAAERAAALADERRLFYVAVTRARHSVICTAVTGGDELELRPSRLLGELGVDVPSGPELAPRVLALPAVVAELRRVASDPEESDALRSAAAAELAELAGNVPGADPDRWWGLLPWTHRALPLVAPGASVELSPSQVEAITTCPLQWFLRRRAGVETSASTSQGFGVLMHALAERVVRSGSLDLEDLQRTADEVWSDLDWEAPWFAAQERVVAREVLRRFADWHRGRVESTEVVGAEVRFELQVGRAHVSGQIDRLERDDEGRGVVVDLKTGKHAAARQDLPEHPQLGLYQLAVAEGGVEGHEFTAAGGGSLLHLRDGLRGAAREQKQPPLEPDENGRTWVHDLLETLVDQVVSEQFPARRNSGCERCEVRRACPAQPTGAQVV